ncbi:hypothetical protein NEOLEDRAFT_1130978 [Neolentinus lepideus HHB14362 ss-1]|uniref:Uncharacterized protein n=1 Tax=Neolentinus lepideus HHB14362 ss-1 TaxID=1314782 RepID=A0A165TZT3_9AGAM|nr:hypothetical protein NEOLEDRAFT_1130978 [Neolentinus lepideus HHB14362 ss-1]
MSSIQSPTTTARSDVPANDHASGPRMPSEVAKPTKVSEEPQQGSTQPGDGSTVHYDAEKNIQYVERPGGKVPWKDQVLGYAKEIRGTMLRKPETKDHGEKILQGEASPTNPNSAARE